MTPGLRLVMACLAIVLLAGCGAQSVRNDFAFNKEQSEGVVVLSVSHDVGGERSTQAIFYVDGGFANGGNLIYSLEPAALGLFGGVLRDSEFDDSLGHVLVLAMPPGRHVINSWQIATRSGVRIFPNVKPAPLEFEVVGGTAKYLGNLHANLLTGKNIFGGALTVNGYPEVLNRQTRDIPMFEAKYPQFKGKVVVDLLPLGPWMQPFDTRKQIDLMILPATK